MSDEDGNSDDGREEYIYVLDYLPGGHSEDRVSDEPIIQGVGKKNFTLLEVVAREDADANIGEFVYVGSGDRDQVERVKKRLDYDELTEGAKKELEYGVKEIVEEEEDRFVDFFNDAGSVTIRMHQLDLLPGVGKTIRNSILDERKYDPFESFDDLEEKISGLHNPKEILVERIIEEIRDVDVKYKIFAR
ncbi:MAG: DUF655 domain-containing protein [Halobacteria archaeon]|nr:DUF655 domain-containing protein [Halobacteria archaeon]